PTVGAGDQLVITLNAPSNGGAVDLTKISSKLGTGATSSWSSDKLRLTITLGTGATITTADTISIVSGNGILDAATGMQELAAQSSIAIGGSFGVAVAPMVTSITALNGDGKPTVGAGDQLVITLNAPSNGGAVDLTKISSKLGTGATSSWSSDKLSLTITLGTGATITTADTISIVSGNGILDAATGTQELAAQSSIAIGGSFGEAVAPNLTLIYAVNSNGNVTTTGDKLVFVFDRAVDHSHFDATKIVVDGGVRTLATVTSSTYAWDSTNTVLTITLGSSATIQNGDTLSFAAGHGIKDATGQVDLTVVSGRVFQGSFGTASIPSVLSAIAYDADGTTGIYGDKIVVMFDRPTNTPVITSEMLRAVLVTGTTVTGSVYTLGDFATASWTTPQTLTITLATYGAVSSAVYANLAIGNSLNLSGLGIRDVTGTIPAADTNAVVLGGTFTPGILPRFLYAIAMNGGAPGAGAGDTIALIFNTATNKPSIDPRDIKVSNGHTFGTGATAGWSSDGVTLTIHVTNGATIQVGDQIDLTNLGIKDSNNLAWLTDLVQTLDGTFGQALAPSVNAVVATDAGNNDSAGTGDKLTITFASDTNKSATVNALSNILGTGASAVWSLDSRTLVITLGSNPQLQDNGTITLDSLGIMDVTGTAMVTGTYQIQGTFGHIAAPVVVSAIAASYDIAQSGITVGSTITITFDQATNKSGTMDKAAIDSIVGLGGKVIGAYYNGVWSNGGKVLTITVVNPAGSTLTVGNTNLTISGMKNALGNSAVTNSSVVLAGSFDGRQYEIAGGTLVRSSSNGLITANVTINKINDHPGNEVIVFELMNGNTPVQITTVSANLTEAIQSFEQKFYGISGDLSNYSVTVHVYDSLDNSLTAVQKLLAESKVIR
ncbi:beta strand repeat-containing protein, partial [Paenibacillus sp. 2RAB27]|uniref:beta strand repeat-containing protein n=1 Tax=Paenibacillus sp. 2RAB27 TaxID=3232991 RepID=UPI003F9B203F